MLKRVIVIKVFLTRVLALVLALAPAVSYAAYNGSPPLLVANGGTGQTTLTDHSVLVGAGTSGIVQVAPSATSGVPLISGGSSADPSFGTVLVAGGGTGAVTLAANGVLIGEGTSAVHVVGTSSTADSVVAWAAAGSDPAALSVNNCATALTYSTSTHAFGCNATFASPAVATAATSASITLSSTNLVTTVVSNSTVATANLPSAVTVGTGWRGCVKDGTEDFAAHNVTLKSPTAGTIDGVAGATGIVMNQTHQELCVISDGANFFVE